jgi:hypothetical protein
MKALELLGFQMVSSQPEITQRYTGLFPQFPSRSVVLPAGGRQGQFVYLFDSRKFVFLYETNDGKRAYIPMDKVKTREVQQCLLYNFKLPIFPLAPTEKQIQDYVNQQLLMSLQRSAAMNRQAGGLIVDDCSQEQLTKNLLKLVEKLF